MKKNKKKKTAGKTSAPRGISRLDLSILLTAVILLVERLPKGIQMRFSDEAQVYIEYYSCFDFVPFGYGDFFPLLTAWLTVAVVLLLLGFRFLGREKLREIALLLTYGAFGTSLVALFMCFRFMQLTAVRAALPVLLFVLIQLLHKCRSQME